MNITTLTLSERERLAYAEGYTETAALLAEMADIETRADTLENELENTKDRLDETEGNYHALIDERDELEDEMHKVRENRDEFEDQAKTYRAALMALEAEVSPAMREFIREVLA
jgi:chromosome segregation ATPase